MTEKSQDSRKAGIIDAKTFGEYIQEHHILDPNKLSTEVLQDIVSTYPDYYRNTTVGYILANNPDGSTQYGDIYSAGKADAADYYYEVPDGNNNFRGVNTVDLAKYPIFLGVNLLTPDIKIAAQPVTGFQSDIGKQLSKDQEIDAGFLLVKSGCGIGLGKFGPPPKGGDGADPSESVVPQCRARIFSASGDVKLDSNTFFPVDMSGFTFGPDNEKLVNSMYYYSYSQPAAAGEKPLIQSGEVDNSYPTVAIGYIQNDTYLPLGFGVIPICSWESFQNDSYWKGTSVVTNLKNNHMCGPFVYISGQNLYPSTVRQILKTYIEVPITIKKTDKGEVEKILNSQGNETGISDSKNILDYVKNNYTNALDTRSNSDDKIYDSALNNKGMFSGNFVDKYIIVKTGDDSYALRTYPAIKITGNLATMPDFVMQFVPTYYSLDDTDPNKTIAYINPDDIMLGNRNKGIYVTDPNIYKKLEKQGLESNEAYGVDGNKITTMDMIQVTGQDEQFTSELGVAAGASVKIMTKSLLEPNNLESSHAAYREFLKDGRIIPEDKAVATRLTNDNGLSQTIDYMKRTSSAQYYLTIGAAVIGVILAIVFIIMIAVKVSKKKKNVNSQTIGGHIKSWFKY